MHELASCAIAVHGDPVLLQPPQKQADYGTLKRPHLRRQERLHPGILKVAGQVGPRRRAQRCGRAGARAGR